MLNVKITNRMSVEDFVARDGSPYILSKRHITVVALTIGLCAAFVIPMPDTWHKFISSTDSIITAEGQAFLEDEQFAHDSSASEGQENYDDFDIPSQFFAQNEHASQQELEDVFDQDEADKLAKALADQEAATKIAGTWADPTLVAGTKLDDNAKTADEASNTEAQVAATTPSDTKPAVPTVRPEGTWYVQRVESGDTLSSIFSFLDLPFATLNRITRVASNKDLLLSIGEPIYFLVDKENVVMEMVKPLGRSDQQVRFTRLAADDDFVLVYEPINAHVSADLLAKIPEAKTMPLAIAAQKVREEKAAQLAKAKAEQEARDKANNTNPNRPRLVINAINAGENFAQAGRRAGLTPSEIETIQSIFKSKVNVSKLRAGDKFRVLFSGIGTSATISAVEIVSGNVKFERFINPDDSNYYGENEFTPTAGIFRRFPLAGEIKINSNFNLHRRHPVTRRISPHNGVDIKAKIGTPVYAPADGTVKFSGYQRAAGYYVIVHHSNNYSTVYMHLSKSEVKTGQKVLAGQLIARTGNTGRTTGPHLHYEVRINDRPVNPMKIELPNANHPNLARKQREAFANNVKVLRADLKNDRLALNTK